jgi:hypothetical protein
MLVQLPLHLDELNGSVTADDLQQALLNHYAPSKAWGGMVSELASGTGIVIGNIERSQLENVRSTLPALASRTIY